MQTEHLVVYNRIAGAIQGVGLELGAVGLDVGGRDGNMVPVIRALGIGRVILVDPHTASVEQAIGSGAVHPEDAYSQKLETYADTVTEPADAAFVFNMQPRLASDSGFIRALGAVIKPQGIVVTSFMEPITGSQFSTNAHKQDQITRVATIPGSSVTGPHAYMHLWQRHAG
jgi:hypothetical protein